MSAGAARGPAGAVVRTAGEPLGHSTPPTLRDRLRPHTRQFVKFAIVGGSGTVVNLLVLKLTLVLWGVLPSSQTFAVELGASALAFCIAVGNNYLLNRWWTFRSRGPIHLEFGRFFTVSLIGLGLNALFFTAFRRYAELHVLWSQLLAIACVLPFNFVANKLWSFRAR